MIGKLLLIGGVGVVGLGAIGDVAARNVAETKIADRAEAAAGGRASASADIDSFPFVLRLLFGGSAGDVSVHVEDVATSSVDLASVDLDLEGVELDRDKLLSDRRAEVTDIERATIAARIDAEVVSRAFGGLDVSLRGGALRARVAGREVAADVSMVADGQLGIRFRGGPSASIRIPHTDLLACDADTFRIEDDAVVVSCSTSEVPPALLRAA
ncbi:MAG TPA: LmeA family phospholipid-binding protein, partial [Acidimicrobiales bacterium]|nr:LmeA family phospholipid-binding protein [Acidimicrobiales bacterium]